MYLVTSRFATCWSRYQTQNMRPNNRKNEIEMKSSTLKNTIIRVNPTEGNYATISNNILFNPKLTSDAKVLLQILLNNKEDWDINLAFYSKKFGWGTHKQSKIIKNLNENGYLVKKPFSKGKDKGFNIVYTISEYGNLKKAIDLVVNEELVQPESIPQLLETIEPKALLTIPEAPSLGLITQSSLPTEEQTNDYVNWLDSIQTTFVSDEDITRCVERVSAGIMNGKITKDNIENEKSIVVKSVKNKILNYGNEIVPNYFNQGKNVQQRTLIEKTLIKWLKDEVETINVDNISTLKLTPTIIQSKFRVKETAITTANRVISGNQD